MKNHQTFKLMAIAALLALLLAGCASTQTAQAPAQAAAEDTSWKYHTIVDAAFVAQYAKVPLQEDVMIIDARPFKPMYIKGHIPMAVSMPQSQFDKLTHMLPAKKDALLIFYCGGTTCKLSHKSAYAAESLGYTNIKVFDEGFPGWMAVKGHYAAVSVEWLKDQLDAKADMVVIDSRPKRTMYDKGHIPGAISMPDTDFDKLTDQLPADKDKQLVFYCGGLQCKLSHKSAARAMALGYTKVVVFADGYPGWTAYMEKLGGAMQAQVKPGKEEGSIDIEAFQTILQSNPASIYLVDVRDPDEFALGHFDTAVNIPVDKLEGQLTALPVDRPVVFVCSTGARSGESYYMVKDLRPELKEVYYLEAQVTFSKDGTCTITPPQI